MLTVNVSLTTDMLKYNISLGYILYFILWKCCVYDLVKFRHRHFLVRARKRSCFCLNTWFGQHKHCQKCLEFSSKTSVFSHHTHSWNLSRVLLKLSSGLTLTNAETQSWTAVTDWLLSLLHRVLYLLKLKSGHEHATWTWNDKYCTNVVQMWQIQ